MTDENCIRECIVSSASDFLTKLSSKSDWRANRVYRGHLSVRWKLVPGLLRKDVPPIVGDRKILEKLLLEKFEKQATPFLTAIPQDKLEWMALAQHHGLPTRLLDWTESPLTALFFAVDDSYKIYETEDGVVWGLLGFPFSRGMVASLEELDEVLKSEPNPIYFPHHTTSRISAQQGCFTIHEPGNIIFPLQDQVLGGEKSIVLEKFTIPSNKKEAIRYELDKLGINHFTLFPDLVGLCRKLTWDLDNNPELKLWQKVQ